MDGKTGRLALLLVVSILLLSSVACTLSGQANPLRNVSQSEQTPVVAGFWDGVVHGILCPFTFIVSLFDDNVTFYEVHNDGHWYDFGFMLGAGLLFGGGSSASRRRSSD